MDPRSEPSPPADSFASMLRTLMQAHPPTSSKRAAWTARLLADRIGADATLVRRWLRNDRVPRPQAAVLAQLSAVLGLSSDEWNQLVAVAYTSRQERLKEDELVSLKERTVAHLVQALPSAARWQMPTVLPPVIEACALPPYPTPAVRAVRGRDQLIAYLYRLMERAAAHPPLGPRDDAIYLSLFGSRSMVPARLAPFWNYALRRVQERGWTVYDFLRIGGPDHASHVLRLIEDTQLVIGTPGRYKPFYLTRPVGTLAVPYGFAIVPNHGALLLLATGGAEQVDSGLYLSDPDQLAILVEHARRFQSEGKLLAPLVTSYMYSFGAPNERERWLTAMTEAESVPGNRFIVRDGLSPLTRPDTYFDKHAVWPRWRSDNERTMEQSSARLRREAFERQVRDVHDWHREICPQSAIERLVKHGQYQPDVRTPYFGQSTPAPVQVIREHLEHVIDLLRTFDYYELALPDAVEERNAVRTYWEAVGDQAVFLESWHPNVEGTARERLRLYISTPPVVKAFQQYGAHLWKQITERHRVKEWVIWWLEDQLRQL